MEAWKTVLEEMETIVELFHDVTVVIVVELSWRRGRRCWRRRRQ